MAKIMAEISDNREIHGKSMVKSQHQRRSKNVGPKLERLGLQN